MEPYSMNYAKAKGTSPTISMALSLGVMSAGVVLHRMLMNHSPVSDAFVVIAPVIILMTGLAEKKRRNCTSESCMVSFAIALIATVAAYNIGEFGSPVVAAMDFGAAFLSALVTSRYLIPMVFRGGHCCKSCAGGGPCSG